MATQEHYYWTQDGKSVHGRVGEYEEWGGKMVEQGGDRPGKYIEVRVIIRSSTTADILPPFPASVCLLRSNWAWTSKAVGTVLSTPMQVAERRQTLNQGQKNKCSILWRRPLGPETPPWDSMHTPVEWLLEWSGKGS